MRRHTLIFSFIFAAGLAYGQGPPSKPKPLILTGVMEGTVFRSDGTTLRGVSVTAFPQSQSGNARAVSALTDADGKFTLKDLDPGLYVLEATRANFIRTLYGQRNPRDAGVALTLGPRQRLDRLDIRMQPSAVIGGHVTDDHNEAVVGARVAALRWGYRGGRKDLVVAGLVLTDDRGEYRLHQLLPGDYFIAAVLPPPDAPTATLMQTVASLVRTGAGRVVYAPTFYPGSSELAGAEQVPVHIGDELLNTNFQMITAGGVRVSGTVRAPFANTVLGATGIKLIAKLHTTFGEGIPAIVDEDGNFEFKNVLPGSYLLTASNAAAGAPLFARMDLSVGNVEVHRLTLSLAPAGEVSGGLRVEGADIYRFMLPLRSLRFQLEPQEGFGTTLTTTMSRMPFATFTFKDVLEGDYAMRFPGLSDDFYVSSIRVGGRELAEKSFPVRGPLGGVEVILGNNPGQIDGSVLDAKDQPYRGARVVLIPSEPRRKRLELYKSLATDQYGNFSFKGVMPGSYKLFAWDAVEDAAWEDPDFLSAYEERGVSVEATAKSKVTQTVRMIPSSTPQ